MNAPQSCSTSASVDENQNTNFYTPRYEISHKDEVTVVMVELPGVEKENLSISIEDSQLELKAHPSGDTPESWKVLYRETTDRAYRLRLGLGNSANQSAITADLEDGVLELAIPKLEDAKPRAIKVR